MNDNVVEFPGKEDKPKGHVLTADEALKSSVGRFTDVLIIGINEDSTKLISTITGPDSVYELSRALHVLHRCLDEM
jgi:hypothetical protein